jgi:hypothetical protein
METQEVRLAVTRDQLEDLRSLLFQEQRVATLTGGSSVAADVQRRRESFAHIYKQLPPGRTPEG